NDHPYDAGFVGRGLLTAQYSTTTVWLPGANWERDFPGPGRKLTSPSPGNRSSSLVGISWPSRTSAPVRFGSNSTMIVSWGRIKSPGRGWMLRIVVRNPVRAWGVVAALFRV